MSTISCRPVRHIAGLGENDLRFDRRLQVIERGDDVPAIHLALVDRLRTVIEASHRRGRPCLWSRTGEPGSADHPVLIQERQLASASRTRWITNITSGRPTSYSSNTRATDAAPGQQPLAEFRHLLAITQHVSRPTRSIWLMCASRLTRIIGQFSRAATCLIWSTCRYRDSLDHHPAIRKAPADGERCWGRRRRSSRSDVRPLR